MSLSENVKLATYEAGDDLSAGQFLFVAIASDGQIDLSTGGGTAVGVLYNKPDAAGKDASVAVAGRVKVVAGAGGLDEGGLVMSASGKGVALSGTSKYCLGTCVKAALEDEVAEVLLWANAHKTPA